MAPMNTSFRESKRLSAGGSKDLSGVFNAKAFVGAGDPYHASSGESYGLAKGKQIAARVPNGLLEKKTSYISIGDKYQKKLKRDARLVGAQIQGIGHSRTVDGALAPTTFITIDDKYAKPHDSYGLAKGKQMIPGPKPSNITVDGSIGGTTYANSGEAHYKNPYKTERDSNPKARGKQMLTTVPRVGSTVYCHAPLGQDAVFEKQYQRLFAGERFNNNTNVRVQTRMAETVAKDQRILEKSRSRSEVIIPQGLPTMSYTRSAESMPTPVEIEAHIKAERYRAKFLKKAPRIARQLDPLSQPQRALAYVGPGAGPQLLGRMPDKPKAELEDRAAMALGLTQPVRSQSVPLGEMQTCRAMSETESVSMANRRRVRRSSMLEQPAERRLDDPSSTPWLRFSMSPAC